MKGEYEMHISIKMIWIISIIAVALSMIWFVIGSTAFFNRNINTFILTFVWIPALIFVSFSIFILKKNPFPENMKISVQIIIISLIVIFSIGFTMTHIAAGNARGGIRTQIARDWIQVTTDGKYEYRIEVVNQFQRNNRVRLYVKSISTDEEMLIPIYIQKNEQPWMSGGEGSIHPPPETLPSWALSSTMISSESENIYILTTNIFKILGETYDRIIEIDIEARAARRIE